MSERFYRFDGGDAAPAPPLPEGYQVRVWQPARDGTPPPLIDTRTNRVWQAFDRLGVFANRECGVLMIVYDDALVHRSLVTPRWFRFPMMADRDLQIGDTWTDPAHRGKGLARAAVAAIHAHWAGRFDRLWYIVGEDNVASIRVIEGFDYTLIGTGERTRPAGIGAIGQFVIRNSLG